MSHTATTTVTEAADKFRATVKDARDITLAVMSAQLEQANEEQEKINVIEKDLEHLPYASFHVIFIDEINQVAVVEDVVAARKGEYRYTSALHDGKRWRSASSYWHKVELAYMQGISEKTLGLNNQFTLFADRMLTKDYTAQ